MASAKLVLVGPSALRSSATKLLGAVDVRVGQRAERRKRKPPRVEFTSPEPVEVEKTGRKKPALMATGAGEVDHAAGDDVGAVFTLTWASWPRIREASRRLIIDARRAHRDVTQPREVADHGGRPGVDGEVAAGP